MQGIAKLSHLIFQNWRRVVRKAAEGWHKSVSREPIARRRSLTKIDTLLLYRHCERIFGDVNIAPLFGESFEGKQIIARPEKPGAETELNSLNRQVGIGLRSAWLSGHFIGRPIGGRFGTDPDGATSPLFGRGVILAPVADAVRGFLFHGRKSLLLHFIRNSSLRFAQQSLADV